jgi:hypothetical protein
MSSSYDTINAIHSDLLKSASPQAQRVIRENPLWFSHFYLNAIEDDIDADTTINAFWCRSLPLVVMRDKPSWFVPHPVLVELVELSRKNHSLQKKN